MKQGFLEVSSPPFRRLGTGSSVSSSAWALVFLLGTAVPLSGQEKAPAPALVPSPYGSFHRVCTVTDPRLDEVSGIAASRRNPGVFYVHNDSQGKPCVYALGRTGQVMGIITLADAENRDWEDISMAPSAQKGTWDLCVADTGDNRRQRKSVVIYRFPEPDLKKRKGEAVTVKPRRYECTFPDGPHNVEGFVVDPLTGEGLFITKEFEGDPSVYRLRRWSEKAKNRLELLGPLPLPRTALPPTRIVTGADIAADGTRFVVRTYVCAWEWTTADRASKKKRGKPGANGKMGLSRFFTAPPALVALAPERQGEAVCYDPGGGTLFTMSEGSPTTLYKGTRKGVRKETR